MATSVPFRPVVVAGTAAAPARPHRLLGETLVAAGAISQAALDTALARQRELEAPLGRILVSDAAISSQALLGALAAQAELPVVDLVDSPPDAALLSGLDPHECLALEAVPWRHVGTTRIVAVSNPARMHDAAKVLGGDAERVAIVLARPEEMRAAILARFGPRLRDEATLRCPDAYSCRTIATRRARTRLVALGLAATAGLVAAPILALQAIVVWVLAMNLATTALRLFALFARLKAGRAVIHAEVPRLADFKKLPTVSLLVPLKGEAKVAGGLIRALEGIDYPAALLDVKIVLEEDDFATRVAVERAGLPPSFEIVTVPRHVGLETKPRAMNFALPFCRGSIVGIYDAEDRPDPGQIRAVVQALGEAPPEVACVQGYLDFYNPDQNWLARCFTIEYAMWFRILLHGVQRLGVPIPLGGTTVFFRRGALEALGGWDAHNVTEDADLGMRLARFGYRCEMIRTVTLEEANCGVGRWIGQRSRWLKGYAITWASHMRAPHRLLRDLGLRGFLGFQVLFLGAITSYLSIPLFWAGWAALAGLGPTIWTGIPSPLLLAFVAALALGQAVMLAVAYVALRDAGRLRMLPWLLALPAYWPLGAVAAWRAVGELFVKPFHWTKTEHGLTDAAPHVSASASLAPPTAAQSPEPSAKSRFRRVS
jgi:glycosyltransferase XagB